MTLFKLIFYIPSEHKETVKEVCFAAGAGQIGNYSNCAWETKGQGQFKPLPGSNPTIGQQEQNCTVEEYLVEMIVEASKLKACLTAFLAAHPYETPAYHVIPVYTLEDCDELV
jgi:hypothetical protein